MQIQTSRFGPVTVHEEDVVDFPDGILGFANLRQFVLLDDPNDEIFAWMQSCDTSHVAFPILEPELFVPNYQLALTKHDLDNLGLKSSEKFRAFSIITIPDDPKDMTANLKAPIVINIEKRVARQIVLQDNNLAIREPIFSKLQSRVVQNPQFSFKDHIEDFDVLVRLGDRGPEAEVDR